jgi:hypothetical protein
MKEEPTKPFEYSSAMDRSFKHLQQASIDKYENELHAEREFREKWLKPNRKREEQVRGILQK